MILYLEEEGLNELLMELRNTDQKICITVILDYVLNLYNSGIESIRSCKGIRSLP